MRSSRSRCRMNLEQKAREDVVLGFGKSASDSLDKYLYEYESEAAYFEEEGVRTTKRNVLIVGALDIIQPAYHSVLAHHRSRALDTFKMSLDSALESDSNKGFADIVRHCSEIVLIEFDRGCAGAIPLPHGSTECLQSCLYLWCDLFLLSGLRRRAGISNKGQLHSRTIVFCVSRFRR